MLQSIIYCPDSVIEQLVYSNPEICNVKGRPPNGVEEFPLHHYLSRNINYDRNVIVLPLEYTKALLMRVKDLVSEVEVGGLNDCFVHKMCTSLTYLFPHFIPGTNGRQQYHQ